jgi:recombination protein RecA
MDLADAALELGYLSKSGSWYSYGEERIGQGRDSVREFLGERPEVVELLAGKVHAAFGFDDTEGAENSESEAPAT